MKKSRIINAAIWATIGIALIVLVCWQWNRQGCGPESLAAAVFEYSAFMLCFCGVVDQAIKERYKNNQ